MANKTFLVVLGRTTLKVMERARIPVVDVTVKKDNLLLYVLKLFGILAGRCGSVVVRERD